MESLFIFVFVVLHHSNTKKRFVQQGRCRSKTQCTSMYINGSTMCLAVMFIFDFSFGYSSNSSVQCLYGGFIVCVLLVPNVSVQRCESV